MKKSELLARVDAANLRLNEQTELETGRSTRRCHAFVMDVLKEAGLVDYSVDLESERGQLEREAQLGIRRALVSHRIGHTLREALESLFGQERLLFDAVLMQGVAEADGESGRHIIAVVTHSQRPVGIVDTLAPGGVVSCDNADMAASYATERFPNGVTELYLGLVREEAKAQLGESRQLVEPSEGGAIVILPTISEPPYI